MAIRGYHQYRGKGRGSKKPLVFLLLLILLGACTFLLLQRHIVYDGSGAHLELPFGRDQQTGEPDIIPDDEIIIQREESTEPKPEPEPEPEPLVLSPLHAWELPHNCLKSDPSSALREREAVVVNIKLLDGSITYATKVTLPENIHRGNEATLGHLQKITSADCYTVARICALCDSSYPAGNRDAAYQISGTGLWQDNYGRTWLDPTTDATADYLCALAKECAQLGFDEILLDQLRFPIEGDLSRSSLSSSTKRPDAIAALVAKIREAAGPQVAVSILLPASLDTDYAFKASGLTATVLAEHFDRIYVPQDSAAHMWVDNAMGSDFDRSTRLVKTGYGTTKGSYMVLQ